VPELNVPQGKNTDIEIIGIRKLDEALAAAFT
jgi:hypothetical protein